LVKKRKDTSQTEGLPTPPYYCGLPHASPANHAIPERLADSLGGKTARLADFCTQANTNGLRQQTHQRVKLSLINASYTTDKTKQPFLAF
jgi:hypothetical protein